MCERGKKMCKLCNEKEIEWKVNTMETSFEEMFCSSLPAVSWCKTTRTHNIISMHTWCVKYELYKQFDKFDR